jgi:hypothetical protein
MPPLPRSFTISLATVTCTLAAGYPDTARASANCSTDDRSLLGVLCPVTTYVGDQTRALTGQTAPPAKTPRSPDPGKATGKASAPGRKTVKPRKPGTPRPPSPSREDAETVRPPRPQAREMASMPEAPDPRQVAFRHGRPVMPQIAPSAPTMRIRAASAAPPENPLSLTAVGAAAGLAGLLCGLNITALSRYRRTSRTIRSLSR